MALLPEFYLGKAGGAQGVIRHSPTPPADSLLSPAHQMRLVHLDLCY